MIHYESPPRKRRREAEDQAIKSFHKAVEEEDEVDPDPLDTANRLLMVEEERKRRLEGLRKKVKVWPKNSIKINLAH